MERNAVDRLAVRALVFLDLDAIGIVGPVLAQRHQVQRDQQQHGQRHGHHMQREEAPQRGIGDAVVAADPFHQPGPDHRDGPEQVHDDLRTPVRHVAPRQHVAHEGLGHQREIHEHAEQPQQFARRLVRAVQQRTEHVQIHDDEEGRSAGGMHVADQPAVIHFAHDVFDGVERRRLARLVVHGEEDAGDQLYDQHHQRQRRRRSTRC